MYGLFEDEDDPFTGTPGSKFLDFVFNSSDELSGAELVRLMERMAAMEILLRDAHGDDLDRALKQAAFERADEVEAMTKSLYIESMGYMAQGE